MGQATAKKHAVFKMLHDKTPLRIEAAEGSSRRLIVSFTSVGTKRDAWPPKEFVGMASQRGKNHVICVTDISRCWMNHPGMARKVAAVIGDYILEHGITQASAVGTSMGAYNALILGKILPFSKVVAFTPQYSVHPDIVPEEKRWHWFRKQITRWPQKAIDRLPGGQTKVVVFHGDTLDEQRHWTRFPEASNVRHFIFAGADHNFVKPLKTHGKLPKIVLAVLNDRPLRLKKMVTRLGGMSRVAYAGFEAAMAYFEGRRKMPRPAGF